MPRNEIAAIIGLIVAIWYVLAGPGQRLGLPRNPRGLATVLLVFVVTFAIVWIVLRLLNY